MPTTPHRNPRLGETFRVLAAAGLSPIADPALDRVLSDCPVCDAGATDPLGLFKPLIVGCSGTGPVRLHCAAGCAPGAIDVALASPSIPWEAVAAEWRDLALDAVAQLERALAPRAVLESVAA